MTTTNALDVTATPDGRRARMVAEFASTRIRALVGEN